MSQLKCFVQGIPLRSLLPDLPQVTQTKAGWLHKQKVGGLTTLILSQTCQWRELHVTAELTHMSMHWKGIRCFPHPTIWECFAGLFIEPAQVTQNSFRACCSSVSPALPRPCLLLKSHERKTENEINYKLGMLQDFRAYMLFKNKGEKKPHINLILSINTWLEAKLF